MVGADGQVQRVTGAQTYRMPVGEPSRPTELFPGYRQFHEAIGAQLGEHRQRIGLS